MRFIEESGGIDLGIKGGPWIDIFPYNPLDPISIEQAEKAILQDRFGWQDWKNMPIRYPETEHYLGIMGYSQQMAIRFLYKDNPLQSLHQIEDAEGGLPPAIATSVYIATQQLQRQNFSPFAILMFAKSASALIKDTRSFPLLTETEIKDLAENALLNVYEKPIAAPLGAGNYPRFLLKLAELCWDLKLVKNLFGKGWLGIRKENSRILLNLSSAWAAHQGWKHIKIEGYSLVVKHEYYPFLWMAWMEWMESGVSTRILQQQIGQRFPDLRSVLDRMDQAELINIPDDLLNGLIHSFTEDAKNHSVYVPQGTFVTIHNILSLSLYYDFFTNFTIYRNDLSRS